MLADPIRAVEEARHHKQSETVRNEVNEETLQPMRGKTNRNREGMRTTRMLCRAAVDVRWMCGHAIVASLNNLSHPVNKPRGSCETAVPCQPARRITRGFLD